MDIEIKIIGIQQAFNRWTLAEATISGKTYKIEIVRFDEPSQYGIGGNGRISKLYITDNDCNALANYDRGWDKRPHTAEVKIVLNAIIEKFN